ncbi:MAG: hypothetical protein P4L65_08845 [Legionella sp.]|nr:hypothetical protein [Legionella sp.]
MTIAVADISDGTIYREEKGTLAKRINFAWSVYSDEDNYTRTEKENALKFLIYAFNLKDVNNINEQLIVLMDDCQKHQHTNPEYVSGKVPSHLPFDPRIEIPSKTSKHGKAVTLGIKQAIDTGELLDVKDKSKKLDRNKQTIFFNSDMRAAHRVHMHDGLFTKNGEHFSSSMMVSHGKRGYGAYTLNANGELSIFTHIGMKDRIAHSSMNAGVPVVAAGELQIVDGTLLALTTHSGHYQPTLFNVHRVLEYFISNGVDISKAKVVTFDDPSISLPYVKTKSNNSLFMYETPATDIYYSISALLNFNIDSINSQIKSYRVGGICTLLYNIKDKLTGSTLTEERRALATSFEEILTAFKASITPDLSVNELDVKISEMGSIIADYEQRNKDLSVAHKKNESSGRFAGRIADFKEQLAELRTESKNSPESDAVSMKSIS